MTRILVSILLALLPAISGLMFNVPSRGEKCLKDEAKKDALITGQYDITALANTNMDIKVTDGKGHTLFQKEAASSGKFAFTLDTRDFINICFTSSYKEGISSAERSELKGAHSKVELTLKRGIEAKNYDEVAKAESLKPLEISMRRLEDLSLEIYNGFSDMKKREEDMRSTNESTNSRVLYFSVFSMFCLVALAGWQVMYLKKYFKTKRLID